MTSIAKSSVDKAGQALADHLDAISLRVRTPDQNAADEIEKIFAEHEAACGELEHQEAHHGSGEDAAFPFR